jgi:acyl-CoA thioester hydrolase
MDKQPASLYKVRFSDCDLFGHLNNSRYLDYFLNAREDHLNAAYNFDLNQFYNQGLGWVVASHDIKYIRPAAYQETVLVQSSLLSAKENSLLVEMLMLDNNKTHLKAALWTQFVPVNIKTGKRENHPGSFMEFVQSIERKDVAEWDNPPARLQNILAAIKEKKAP